MSFLLQPQLPVRVPFLVRGLSSSASTTSTTSTLTSTATSTTTSTLADDHPIHNYFDIQYFGAERFTDSPATTTSATAVNSQTDTSATAVNSQDTKTSLPSTGTCIGGSKSESYFVGESEDTLSVWDLQYFRRVC